FVDVAVPDHRRGEDQVARLHLAAAAVDDGHRTFRAGGEADCGAGVTVWAGALARVEHGEGGEHCARGRGFRTEGRMRHDQRPPLDIVDCDFGYRAVERRLDLAPTPEEGSVRRLRLDWGNALVAVPQRMQVHPLKLAHKPRPF